MPDAMNQPYDLSKILAQGDSIARPPDLSVIATAGKSQDLGKGSTLIVRVISSARFANNGVTQTLMSNPLTLGKKQGIIVFFRNR